VKYFYRCGLCAERLRLLKYHGRGRCGRVRLA